MELAKKILELNQERIEFCKAYPRHVRTIGDEERINAVERQVYVLAVQLAKETLAHETKTTDPAILETGPEVKQLVERLRKRMELASNKPNEYAYQSHEAAPEPWGSHPGYDYELDGRAADALESLSARLSAAEERVRELKDIMRGVYENLGPPDEDGEYWFMDQGAVDKELAEKIIAALKGGTDV